MDISSNSSWRTRLPQDFRQNIFKPIRDTLERTMNPMEELSISRELLKTAWRFEEEMFHAATDWQDYLRKMSSLDTRAQATPANAMQGRLGGAQGVVKSLDPGATLLMQNGAQSLIKSVQLPDQVLGQAQQRQAFLAQSLQSNLPANVTQSSSGMGSTLLGFTGIAPHERLPQQGALHPQQPTMYDLQQHEKQPSSPEMTSEHLSPRTDHQYFTEPLQIPKLGSPLQQVATLSLKTPSPLMLPGASPPLHEGINVKIAAHAIATTGSAQTLQYSVATPNNLAGVGTPGPSSSVDFCPSPAEMAVLEDVMHALSPGTPLVDKTNLDPVDRLIANIYSKPVEVLSSAVQEMTAVISCNDKLGASGPGNGSRAAVREDLASITKARVKAMVWTTQDSDTVRKKPRYMDSIALSLVSSDGSIANSLHRAEGFNALQSDSMINSNLRIPRKKVPLSVREEVRQINCCLIDIEVAVSEEGTEEASAHGKEGIVVTCSYKGVAVSPSLAQNTMISFPHLLVSLPPSYPLSSPTYNFDDMAPNSSFPVAFAARDEFVREVRYLIAPVTLKAIAACWDRCARNALAEFARHHGGGTLSTSFGVWENYVIPDP